jgi:hypothetical protein
MQESGKVDTVVVYDQGLGIVCLLLIDKARAKDKTCT